MLPQASRPRFAALRRLLAAGVMIAEPEAMLIVWVTMPLPTPTEIESIDRPPADVAPAGTAPAPRPAAITTPAVSRRRSAVNLGRDACGNIFLSPP